VTDPLTQVITYTYSKTGKVLTETLPAQSPSGGTITATYTYAYDADDRLSTITDPNSHVTTYAYDGVGNKTAVTDGNNHTTSYAYDSRNRLTTITDANTNTTVYGYDSGGNQQTVTDGPGHVTTTLYDALNRVTTITQPTGGGTTTMAYDVAGRETGLTDPVGNHTTWQYDSADRLTTLTDPLGHNTTYVYDNANQLTDKTDRDGRRVTYSYDSGGRQIGETWVGASPAETITSGYDNVGRLTSVSDSFATLTYTYDSGGNQLTEQTSGPGTGQPSVTLTSSYNTWHDRTLLVDNISPTRTVTYQYDIPGRLTTITADSLNYVYGYDPANNLTSLKRVIGSGGGVTTSYQYDPGDRLVTLTHSGNGVAVTYVYGYDAANRVTSEQDKEGTATFTYDNSNQLTAVGGSRTESYGYDANGNRNTTGYSTGTGNELTASPTATYAYDNEGNLSGRTDTGTSNVWTFSYDYRNRETGVVEKNSGGTTIYQATYTYDAKDRRIGENVSGGGQTWHVYDGKNPYADYNGSGSMTTRYLYANGLDALLARATSAGTTSWYLLDELGTVRDIAGTGINAGVIDHIVYGSFGGVASESSPANGDRFRFTAREYDTGTGLYYFRARYYDPVAGRFLINDSIGFAGRDTNLYRYVANSPASSGDPTGHLNPVLVGAASGLIYGLTKEAIDVVVYGEKFEIKDVCSAVIFGAAMGGLGLSCSALARAVRDLGTVGQVGAGALDWIAGFFGYGGVMTITRQWVKKQIIYDVTVWIPVFTTGRGLWEGRYRKASADTNAAYRAYNSGAHPGYAGGCQQ
jgi:RHS repeat-associated protein